MTLLRFRHVAAIIGCIGLAIAFLLRGCKPEPTILPALKEDEKAKIVFTKGRITTVTKDNPTPITKFVPSHSVVTLKEDGTLHVYTKKFGLASEPGIGVGMLRDDFRWAFDVKWLYYNQFGCVLGVNGKFVNSTKAVNPRLHLGLSWNIPHPKFSNTSFVIAIDQKKDGLAYVRLSF